jgi:hypothetical protein
MIYKMQKVINRKNIIVKQLLASPTFTQTFNLPFQPDQVTVKAISYCGTAIVATKAAQIAFINCSMVNEVIGTIFDGCAYSPDLIFPLKSFTNHNDWNFRIEDQAGATNANFTGTLAIHLEFTQHENQK